jgi:predicted amidohydrolase
MTSCRVALANLQFPEWPGQSVSLAVEAIRQAGEQRVDLICFPECYVPGYRAKARKVPPADASFLEEAWIQVAAAADRANVGVLLGTERIVHDRPVITTLIVNRDGSVAGWQDKVQLDSSEEGTYAGGSERRVFTAGPVIFGVAICHEGWRYPETVRYAARRGAQIVFIPHFHEAEPGSFRPTTFADPANTFHEKALLCRAAENTCFVAAANYASDGSPTTSAIAKPDGSVLAWQRYGVPGLLVADLNLAEATGLLASRLKTFDDVTISRVEDLVG